MSNITAEDMQALQTNNYNVFAAMARPALMKFVQTESLSADAKNMVNKMNQWDLYNHPNAEGITVFKIIWDSVENAVWGDELAGSSIPLTKPECICIIGANVKR